MGQTRLTSPLSSEAKSPSVALPRNTLILAVSEHKALPRDGLSWFGISFQARGGGRGGNAGGACAPPFQTKIYQQQ